MAETTKMDVAELEQDVIRAAQALFYDSQLEFREHRPFWLDENSEQTDVCRVCGNWWHLCVVGSLRAALTALTQVRKEVT